MPQPLVSWLETLVESERDVADSPTCHHHHNATSDRRCETEDHAFVEREHGEFSLLIRGMNEQAVPRHIHDFFDATVMRTENAMTIFGTEKDDGELPVFKR